MNIDKNTQKKIDFINDYKSAQNAASGSKYDANSNVTDKNIATLAAELPKKDNIMLQRAILCSYIERMFGPELAEQYIKDLDGHLIYRHDETSGSGGFPYCASITLYPFLLNGLKGIGGSSDVPKHVESFIGGFCNLLFATAAQFAGAVATPEFLTYFDHFLRVDYGYDYPKLLDTVVEDRASGPMTLRKKIEGWFGQTVYTINQPAAARGSQSIFWNVAYFDKFYFESIFKDFIFPDMDTPCWETTKVLQKMFMKWFNKERLKVILTFPVETMNLLVKDGKYADEDTTDFAAEMWSEGASFFCYQSDSVDSLSSCCRLRNGIEDNVFSYTLGAGGIETGSKAVITLNLSRIVQDWDREGRVVALSERIKEVTQRVHKYLAAFNEKLWDDYRAGLLGVYKAGFIDLDRQYLTVGVNAPVEAAEYLGIKPDPFNEEYKQYVKDTFGVIEACNREDRTTHCHFNLELVPAENLGAKNYAWDKQDGYWVPEGRNLYNSYFYPVEDKTIDPIKKFYYQGYGFADICSGGVALHNNLEDHLSKQQYRLLMDVAIKAGCNYFTYNIPNAVCPKCGFISKHPLHECPHCGNDHMDYATRVIGYLKLISNFPEPRQVEAHRRYYGKLTTDHIPNKE